MQRWENMEIVWVYDSSTDTGYWADTLNQVDLVQRLNSLGADGWELAAVFNGYTEQQSQIHYCLKRPYG